MKAPLTVIVSVLVAGLITAPALAREATKEEEACLKAYHQVHDALAKDDLASAKKSASELAEKATAAKCGPAAKQHADELTKSNSLESAREHFKAISEECIKMAAGIDGQYVFTCAMAKAEWLQTDSKQVSNPYMGKKMPTCGELKK